MSDTDEDQLLAIAHKIATDSAAAALRTSKDLEPVMLGLIAALISCARENDGGALPAHSLGAMVVDSIAMAYELDVLDVLSAVVGLVTATLADEGDERATRLQNAAQAEAVKRMAQTVPNRPRRILTVSRRRSRK